MDKKEDKNYQIITAATIEFLEKGFDAASMQKISEKAMVSKRTLYKYYPSKDELYNALIDEILNKIEGIYKLQYSYELSVKKQLEDLIETKIKIILTESFLNLSKIILGEQLKSRRPSKEQLQKFYQSEEAFVHWIEEAKKDKKITSKLNSIEIADQFHSILKGQVYYPVLFGWIEASDIDFEKVKKQITEFFINSFCTK